MPLDRRSVLEGIGAIGATLTFAGLATASDGHARYVVNTNGNVADEIRDAGYDVLNELAGGNVLLVAGPEGGSDELAGIDGVSAALRDFDVALEDPVLEEDAGTDEEGGVDHVYDQYLWDKQVQQVREAHEHATGAGRTVAVLDTGVDDTHPDLNVDVENSAVITDGQPVDHDGPRGGDHATHVAGTIAGTGEVGMLGTAPDATIVSVRILGPETGTWGDILAAMEYAAAIGVDAANMSIGTSPIPPEANAAQYRRLLESVANNVTSQGTLLVGSAGNSDTSLQEGGLFTLPNSLAGVMSISATAPNDLRSFFSNYGTSEIAVGAPGGAHENLIATYCGYAEWVEAGRPTSPTEDPRESGEETAVCFDEDGALVVATTEDDESAAECRPCTISDWPYPFNLVYSTVPGGYGWKAGTSMAAPQVSGLAALVREVAPDANAQRVQNAIQQGAEGESGRGDPEVAAGRTNALATLERLQ